MIVTVDLSEKDIERLDHIKSKNESASRSEAIRFAIRKAHDFFCPKNYPQIEKQGSELNEAN